MGQLTIPGDVAMVSDGYHTFAELYEQRHCLFIALLMAHREIAFKTRRNDKGEQWDGWFIAGLDTPHGQITYHLPKSYWDLVPVEGRGRNATYDGHNSTQAMARLLLLAAG